MPFADSVYIGGGGLIVLLIVIVLGVWIGKRL